MLTEYDELVSIPARAQHSPFATTSRLANYIQYEVR